MVWVQTPKINRAIRLFLKFDTGTVDILKIDKRQGYFFNSTGDMGLKIVSDMQPGYFP